MIQQSLARLLDGHDLTRATRRAGRWREIMAGEATQAQIAGFLVALRAKGETADEIAGCAEAMREHVLRVSPTRTDLVDVVGTGGDGANTYNISTAAALVAAAAGAAVAKHGNRAASSQTGAADVLEALGFRARAAARADRALDRRARLRLPLRAGAPSRHAARGARPARARDAYRLQRARPARRTRRARAPSSSASTRRSSRGRSPTRSSSSTRRARTSCTAPAASTSSPPAGRTSSARSQAGPVREYELDPLELGIERCDPDELRGGDPADERGRPAGRARRRGRRPPLGRDPQRRRRDRRRGEADDLREGIAQAREAIDSGAAAARLDELVEFSRCMRFADSTLAARLRRDRRVQAALAVGRRHQPGRAGGGRRARPTRPEERAPSRCSSTTRSPARSTTCARRARRSACRCSRRASSRPRSTCARCGRRAPTRRSSSSATSTTQRPRSSCAPRRSSASTRSSRRTTRTSSSAPRASAPRVIGVNARDLGTFRIDRAAQLELVAKAPRDRVVVAESAVHTRAQAAAAELAGAERRPRRHVADARGRAGREAARAALAAARQGLRADAAGGRRRRGRGRRRPVRLHLRRGLAAPGARGPRRCRTRC